MSRIVFLLEEPSMRALLEKLLPRLFPQLQFLCIAHEGKRDLELSIPRKLKAWPKDGSKFIVVRDNDGGDCRQLKQSLAQLCAGAGRADAMVRIVCQELEAWYLGEPPAIAAAFGDPKLAKIGLRAKFRNPDIIIKPSRELYALCPHFQKVNGARLIADFLSYRKNCSSSFRIFVEGVAKLANVPLPG